MSRPHLTHRIEFVFVVSVAWALVHLPERMAAALGSTLGWVAGSVLRIRRGVVEENLRRAFPGESASWYGRVAGRSYCHLGREVVSVLRFGRMRPEEVRDRCVSEGFELLQDPISRGQSVMALTGHFGNWEVAAVSVTARGVPLDAVVRRQRNPLFDAYLIEARRRLGMGVVYQHEATRAVMKSLREGKVLALVADQNFAGEGVFVDFFGVSASTARGPGVLAIRTGVPVVFTDARRLPGLKARYRLRFSPVSCEATGDLDEDVYLLTRAYMAKLEEVIRESPEQYFWFHRRWKKRPSRQEPGPSEQVADEARRTTAQTEPAGGDSP